MRVSTRFGVVISLGIGVVILYCRCCACAVPALSAARTRISACLFMLPPVLRNRCSAALEWKDDLPVAFHVHDGPVLGPRFVETFVELADAGLAVVGPFALCVGMVNVETQPRSIA